MHIQSRVSAHSFLKALWQDVKVKMLDDEVFRSILNENHDFPFSCFMRSSVMQIVGLSLEGEIC